MNFKIIPTAVFAEKAKLLAKRYPSMKDDLSVLQNELLENPYLIKTSLDEGVIN